MEGLEIQQYTLTIVTVTTAFIVLLLSFLVNLVNNEVKENREFSNKVNILSNRLEDLLDEIRMRQDRYYELLSTEILLANIEEINKGDYDLNMMLIKKPTNILTKEGLKFQLKRFLEVNEVFKFGHNTEPVKSDDLIFYFYLSQIYNEESTENINNYLLEATREVHQEALEYFYQFQISLRDYNQLLLSIKQDSSLSYINKIFQVVALIMIFGILHPIYQLLLEAMIVDTSNISGIIIILLTVVMSGLAIKTYVDRLLEKSEKLSDSIQAVDKTMSEIYIEIQHLQKERYIKSNYIDNEGFNYELTEVYFKNGSYDE